MVLSRYYKVASLILPIYNYISNQLNHWKEYILKFHQGLSIHDKYIFTSDHLDKMAYTNKYLKDLFELLKNDSHLKNKLEKLSWNLIKFYNRLGFESWAVLTIIELNKLNSNKRKKMLYKNRKKIFNKTIKEYEKQSLNHDIGIEYSLYKDKILYTLDRYILNEYIIDKHRISFLEKTLKDIPEGTLLNILSEPYIDLIIDISVKINDYDLLLKYLNIQINNFIYRKEMLVRYKFLHSITSLSRNIFQGEHVDIKSEKEKLDLIINQIFPAGDIITKISKPELNKLRNFIFLYYDILSLLLKIKNVTIYWEDQINEGKNVVHPEWVKLSKHLVLQEMRLEILMYSTITKDMLKKIFLLKQVFNFFKNIGSILQNSIEGIIFRSNLKSELISCYRNFSNNIEDFSEILLSNTVDIESKNYLSTLTLKPLILPIQQYYGEEKNPNIQITSIIYEKTNRRFRLKCEIPKEDLINLAKYPFSFLSNIDWDLSNLINKEIQLGLFWIEDALPIYSSKKVIKNFTEIDHNFLIDFHFSLKKNDSKEIYITPYIENERFSKIMFGGMKKINADLYKMRSSTDIILVESIEDFKRVTLTSYEIILEKMLELILGGESIGNEIFKDLNEPEIRNLFLIFLNAIFVGKATGETFNKKGKTDIIMKDNNYNLFICECKFWSGQKNFIKTIEQLFRYKTWRDSKTAILLFNKTVEPSTVLGQINPVVESHPNYVKKYDFVREKLRREETLFGYIFRHPEDRNREFHLSILVFNMN